MRITKRWNEHPKFRVSTYGDEYAVDIKRFFDLGWRKYEDFGEFGVTTYETETLAEQRIKDIILRRIEIQQRKESLSGKTFSVEDFKNKYPEEFL